MCRVIQYSCPYVNSKLCCYTDFFFRLHFIIISSPRNMGKKNKTQRSDPCAKLQYMNKYVTLKRHINVNKSVEKLNISRYLMKRHCVI